MSPEFLIKWQHIIDDVDKTKIPVQFVKKIVVKLEGKRQHTINIEKFLNQGLEPDQIEEAVGKKLLELDDQIVSIDFVLNVQNIADTVQPETDELLKNL